MDQMNITYYDIESLTNVYTCASYNEKTNHTIIWYLIDTPELLADPTWQQKAINIIKQENLNYTGSIGFLDLKTDIGKELYAKTFGCYDADMINDPKSHHTLPKRFRLICDTDKEYNAEKHPYLMGYNSFNYDTTMHALFLKCITEVPPATTDADGTIHQKFYWRDTTAKNMREYNDLLFTPKFKPSMPSFLYYNESNPSQPNYQDIAHKIRRCMLMSGRHLDVARLNEKQSKVSLKRLLGMLGFQIKESNKLKPGQNTIETPEQLYDLFAYNCSDIFNLKQLMHHRKYQGQFELKKGLLDTYPELIYNKKPNEYMPDIRPEAVRRDRLNIDSSSAQFSTKCLCPYDHLTDIETVSFLYPAKEKADELGIQQVNVLEESRKFFYKLYPNRPDLQKEFDRIYFYYKDIEGKNFNDSTSYQSDYPNGPTPMKLTDVPKPKDGTFLYYYDNKGEKTSCYIIFSTGGIHGAEYNKELFEYDMAQYQKLEDDYNYAKSIYPNAIDLRNAKTIQMPDGRELKYNYFLKATKIADSQYKEIGDKKPKLYEIKTKGGKKVYELNKKYTFTSHGFANHEDFTSYYPNLLRMMMAFYNKGLGYDRYADIFQQKEDFGKMMKDSQYTESEKAYYDTMRNGTKLILNSASGAADAQFENNIRVNNQIISMRIIGQLFSWRIGQAQSFEGAKMISTNTDGLYSVMEETLNNSILTRESADIGVAIEPEPLFLISKDTNNRTELTTDMKILGASGGTLGCRKGPDPEKSLSHPAIIDWALCEYLIYASQEKDGISLSKAFDETVGMNILHRAKNEFDTVKYLNMFQNMIVASTASQAYPYGTTAYSEEMDLASDDQIVLMQHYNRAFIMKDGTPNTLHLYNAAVKKITDATMKKRARDNMRPRMDDDTALYVLAAQGIKPTDIPHGKEAVSQKITNVEPTWYMYIDNNDLSYLSPQKQQFIIDNLDLNKYLELLKSTFENSWRNHLPETEMNI